MFDDNGVYELDVNRRYRYCPVDVNVVALNDDMAPVNDASIVYDVDWPLYTYR